MELLRHRVNVNIAHVLNLQDKLKALPFNHVLIDELGHDSDGHSGGRGAQNILDLGVLHIHIF